MKACWLAACAAIGICLFTGGCEPSSTGSSGGDVAALRSDIAALRGDVDRLNAEVARLKSRVVTAEARLRVPSGERAKAVDGSRLDEMRRRHEERMRRQQQKGEAPAQAPSAN